MLLLRLLLLLLLPQLEMLLLLPQLEMLLLVERSGGEVERAQRARKGLQQRQAVAAVQHLPDEHLLMQGGWLGGQTRVSERRQAEQ